MTTSAEMKAATDEGRAAKPGTNNPYAGDSTLARCWRLGYKSMLVEMLKTSPARQPYLDAQQT